MATYYSQGNGNFSTLANWNTATNGSGSAPASVAAMNNQTMIVQHTHTVTFDIEDAPAVDGSVSGWTTGITLKVEGSFGSTPGELVLSTSANTPGLVYGLRFITIEHAGMFMSEKGRIRGGTAETPIPSNVIHRWKANETKSTSYGVIKLSDLDVQIYAQPPTEAVYRLTAAADIGATELQVEGDKLGGNPQTDVEWRAGWMVWLVDDYDLVASKAYGERTTLAATPVGDGVINLAAPLTRAYDIGAPVILGQRNVEITYDDNYSSASEMLIQGGGGIESVFSCAITNSKAFTTYGSCMGYGVVGSGIRLGPAAVLAGMYSAGRLFGGTFEEGSVIVGTRHGIYNLASGVVVDLGSCEIYGAYDAGVLGQSTLGFAFDGVIERSKDAVYFSGGAVELNGIIRGCGSGVTFSSSGIEARSITGSVAISDCKVGMSCGGGGFEIGGTIGISGCERGLYGKGFALRDSVTISGCDWGCYQVSDSSFGDDVVISNCPIGLFDGWGIEFSGNAKVTGAAQGLREMSHVIIGGNAEIQATEAAVDCCMKVLLKDSATLTCSDTTARLTGDMLIVGPDITCGTNYQWYTFDRCAVRVENATVFPVLAGE